MKMKKSVIGLVSAFMIVGASATVYAASEGTGNVVDQISSKITTFTGGTIDTPVVGQEMKKVILDENISVEMKEVEPGSMKDNSAGKVMLKKEIIEE